MRLKMGLFPAHAGVIPHDEPSTAERNAFPRTRGGDPCSERFELVKCSFSPHTRG